MRILLTNDDGIKSEGIKVLERCLAEKGHEVWVCAPESQRSANSHAIHMETYVEVKKVGDKHYSCFGFPADCVLFFAGGAFKVPGGIDLIISGINQGYNVGTDIIYSATCGAASEAVLRGYRAIAISCGRCDNGFCFEDAGKFIAENLDMLLARIRKDSFVNVNVPPKANGSWKETELAHIDYHDRVQNLDGTDNFMLCSSNCSEAVGESIEKTDFYCARTEGKISVSTINVYSSTVRIS